MPSGQPASESLSPHPIDKMSLLYEDGTPKDKDQVWNSVEEEEEKNERVMERTWVRPDLPSKCTWKLGDLKTDSPHIHAEQPTSPSILPNILRHIGETPLVRINKIPKMFGVKCEICEYDDCFLTTDF
ncbi:hypothetical protein AMELA_G00084940 [Ameiurus melas]|uniref:Uncharacterized protein n=1 Tax=Ameiurus melas TaxID=219545 RepID=A0A7J6AUE7_AMEME|nr:hypothetical protein AMELA_G00084940 [Ameiurus melas]